MSCPALREKKKPLAGQLSFCTQIEIVWRRFTFRAAVSLRLQTYDDLQGHGSRWEVNVFKVEDIREVAICRRF